MNNHPFHALSEGPTGDYRAEPTFCCPCGSDLFLIATIFDPDTRLPGMYLLDAMCAHCGALVKAPCPIDEEAQHGL